MQIINAAIIWQSIYKITTKALGKDTNRTFHFAIFVEITHAGRKQFRATQSQTCSIRFKKSSKASRCVSWTISTRQPLIRNKVGGEEQVRRSVAETAWQPATTSGSVSSQFLFRCYLRTRKTPRAASNTLVVHFKKIFASRRRSKRLSRPIYMQI